MYIIFQNATFRHAGIYYSMEILMLVLLYYLSQNPDFAESVKPLMGQLKNSQQMLNFLNDLSKFSETFSTLKQKNNAQDKQGTNASAQETSQKSESREQENEKEKPPQSPTTGIADDFIQKILDGYLKK